MKIKNKILVAITAATLLVTSATADSKVLIKDPESSVIYDCTKAADIYYDFVDDRLSKGGVENLTDLRTIDMLKANNAVVNKVYTINDRGAKTTVDLTDIYFNSLEYLAQKRDSGDKQAILNFMLYLNKFPQRFINEFDNYLKQNKGQEDYVKSFYFKSSLDLLSNLKSEAYNDNFVITFFRQDSAFGRNYNTSTNLYYGAKNKTYLRFLGALAVKDFETVDKILKKINPMDFTAASLSNMFYGNKYCTIAPKK